MEAILLLGHGSRLTEANKALEQVAHLVKEMGDIQLVETAFLQFEKPDFFEGVTNCISKGAKRIIVHPYFLYKGRHFEEDITEMIGQAQEKYADITFALTEPLGVHKNIAKVVLERTKNDPKEFKMLKPREIEERSLEIISEELGGTDFREIELPIVKRVIHASGDFDFAKNMRFHPEAVEAGIEAIRNGKDILVDTHMVEAGINKNALKKFGGRIICNLSRLEVEVESRRTGKTRSGIAIEMGAEESVGMVAIGNAPTALYRAMKLIDDGSFRPGLVIGVPVGFVKAVESKEVLLHVGYPFITALGRKGGSPVAAAIVNAFLKMAQGSGG